METHKILSHVTECRSWLYVAMQSGHIITEAEVTFFVKLPK